MRNAYVILWYRNEYIFSGLMSWYNECGIFWQEGDVSSLRMMKI